MKQKPLLSVIVPNYNKGPFLAQCLESILEQTYPELEIIVCDDGSSDSCPGIIKEYEEKYPGRVRGIYNQSNKGPAHARHQAILAAKGEYIATLDSDDLYYDPDKLTREMDLIERYQEIEKKDIMAFSNVVMLDRDGNLKGTRDEFESVKQGKILAELLGRNCMIPLDFIMKKSVYFEVGGYDISLSTHEDWDLKLKLSKKHEYIYTRTWGTAYRLHPGGLSRRSYGETTNNLYRVFARHICSEELTEEKRKTAREEFVKVMAKRNRDFVKKFNNPGPLKILYLRLLGILIGLKWKILG